MATIKTIVLNSSLRLDLHDDGGGDLYVSIRRERGGLVRVDLPELRALVDALVDASAELAARAVGRFEDE